MRGASRAVHVVGVGLLSGVVLLGGASSALADDAPTEAGTTFRTAAGIEQGERAEADASNGDYLYWVFPAGAGENVTAKAVVNLPEVASRHGAATWRLDVFDGLRRRQACASGHAVREAGEQAESVTLRCRLRTVRPWAEPWSNDPLPGSYYLRLTVVDVPERDLGLPVRAVVSADSEDAGGSVASGGELTAPLGAVVRAGSDAGSGSGSGSDAGDGEGDSAVGGWWSDRWLWTVGGGVLGALAGVGGYTLARRPRRGFVRV
ncbi:hypothetical protein [Streptomyces sp. H27-D2]|uniref:hypothetical protein n=1 Tax=Streptomyces sp. H27-D2 TaxID=3046304 RepID=UPI002DBFABC3|nr:hypothetical protein [Streptomyces sp. H27-D2]MEC4017875.1 hypothetical protein [Streptomyces sp. H27-D2]